MVLGYFCHLVSLGLTLLALGILALLAPIEREPGNGSRARLHRLVRSAVCVLPLVPLGFVYLGIARRGGPMHPLWENLGSAFSMSAWVGRLGWVDPLTLALKGVLPFTDRTNRSSSSLRRSSGCGRGLLWMVGSLSLGKVRPGVWPISVRPT